MLVTMESEHLYSCISMCPFCLGFYSMPIALVSEHLGSKVKPSCMDETEPRGDIGVTLSFEKAEVQLPI